MSGPAKDTNAADDTAANTANAADNTVDDAADAARRLRRNAQDVAANRRRGGELRVTLSPGTVGCASGFGGVLRLEPGEFVTEHYHPYSEEFLHVISGRLRMLLDGEPVRLGPGDSLFVPINVRHRLENTGQEPATGVFHLSPLAPRPELGHVDTEPVFAPHQANPRVGPPE